jgi:hypothetical protein
MSANEAGDNTHQTHHQARSMVTKKGREAQHTDISSEHQSGEVGEDELNTGKTIQPVPRSALIPRPLRESNVRLEHSIPVRPAKQLEITLVVSRFAIDLLLAPARLRYKGEVVYE